MITILLIISLTINVALGVYILANSLKTCKCPEMKVHINGMRAQEIFKNNLPNNLPTMSELEETAGNIK